MALGRYTFLIFSAFALSSYTMGQFAKTFKKGVGLGGWLMLEPFMLPDEWKAMGGEDCPDNPATCASTEWGLGQKLGQEQTNKVFLKHWQTWFTQEWVDRIKALHLDHVSIPLGFWIIEELVKNPEELYARGGWNELKRGLRQLKAADISVLLKLHAMPGVASPNALPAGNYTDQFHFYEDPNYQRALTWIAILAAFSHLDPDFQSVLGILALNNPHTNATETPGLGQYYADFVTIVRVIELGLGVSCDADLTPALQRMVASHNVVPSLQAAIPLLPIYAAKAVPPVDVNPLVDYLTRQINGTHHSHYSVRRSSPSHHARSCLTTVARPKTSQLVGKAESMAPSVLGPRAFSDHIYSVFGLFPPETLNATHNYEDYLNTICSHPSYELAKRNGEVPFGREEFSLKNRINATDAQLRGYGDAQKYRFREESHWTFWTFRIDDPISGPKQADEWSYTHGVQRGLLTENPGDLFNASICAGREKRD